MQTTKIMIGGMQCDGCAERIHTLLEKELGVRKAEVSYEGASARITFNEHAISEPRLREVVERAGFAVHEA